MERDFLGLGSNLSPITVKEETNQDSAPSRGMMDWSFSSKVRSVPQFLSFGTSQQETRRNLVNNELLSSCAIDQNRRTNNYSSVQEVRMFPVSSQQDQPTITASMSEPSGKSFINKFITHQPMGSAPIMAPPVSVFPAPTNIRSSSKPIGSSPSQLTIFYAGSVSVYQDITPEKAQAIMLLAGNGPQAKPVSQPKPLKLVQHSPATIDPLTMPPSFLPSISYTVSKTESGFNEVTGLRPTKTMASLVSTHNNQTNAFIMTPTVGLPQTRKASLARFLEKRKDRVINVSPYYVDNKSSIDCRTRMSESLNA